MEAQRLPEVAQRLHKNELTTPKGIEHFLSNAEPMINMKRRDMTPERMKLAFVERGSDL